MSFSSSRLKRDASAQPDSEVTGDASLMPDGQVTPDALVQTDGEVPPDALVQPDGQVQPSCIPADCPLGCNSLLDRCNRLAPRNFDVQSFYDQLYGGILAPTEDIDVDTDSGKISTTSVIYRPEGSRGQAVNGIFFDVITQPGSVPLAVFGLAALEVPGGIRVTVNGSAPAAFYIAGDLLIEGHLIGSASINQAGPGGGAGGPADGAQGGLCYSGTQGLGGEEAGSGSEQLEAGGGGGGFRGEGGQGGDGYYGSVPGHAFGGQGGAQTVTTYTLTPLAGGCGGGAGGGPDTAGAVPNSGGSGGGGGGGIQLAVNGDLLIGSTAVLSVAGGQGRGGQHGAGGGAGGSGGALLLEAANIEILGTLAANGGGGGAGAPFTSDNGLDGQPGLPSDMPAQGGLGADYGGDGGSGGAGDYPDGTDGQTDANGGGGGGGAGLILLASPGALSYQSAVISPGSFLVSGFVSDW
ncbi:MAG: hypothetical protein RBU30_10265 [Polyangia bacterium]|nr:hypothetical protein [Polyangia bacterium]